MPPPRLQQLPPPTPRFARLIGEDPREFDSLAELLTAQMTGTVRRSRQRLEQELPGVIEVWDRLQQALVGRTVEPRFVHGDFCPPNVYVSDRDGTPAVTGVGDFSPHTLVADPLLDITGAVAFLELEDYPEAAADAAWLTEEAVRRLGPDAAVWIGHYRVVLRVLLLRHVRLRPRHVRLVSAPARGSGTDPASGSG